MQNDGQIKEADYEKLGVFYLGRLYDTQSRATQRELLLYDSNDLLTHGFVVGMTGSGKTGLCISMLEEAAIDGVPAIVIDPKGDLGNLLLTFPNLAADDFQPWIDVDEARRVEDYAETVAGRWRKGLGEWGQSAERIGRLRAAADFAIYTPGSTSGRSLSILKSFAPPESAVMNDEELLAERIETTVTSLLGLIGIAADPIQSREHILLSNLLSEAWSSGREIDLAALIELIQQPPMQKVGVLDLETFFPSKARFELAMRLNNLLAAPGFAAWLNGEPLDIGSLLYTSEGRPRVSIMSIAHLNDAERMFFLSLLLNQLLGWMRQQSGTSSLRAIFYMDEIAGYLPPVANPPSKAPMLTLLKQARAFGLGLLLATQNPMDIDYKALANCGTWFIGRLQTERDKARLLDGLEGALHAAGGNLDRANLDAILSGLGGRVFLMNNVHEGGPVAFMTRWAMSYLRGPLTRMQIKTLSAMNMPSVTQKTTPATVVRQKVSAGAGSAIKPAVGPGVEEVFLPPSGDRPTAGQSLVYQPRVLAIATVYFSDARKGVHEQQTTTLLADCAAAAGSLDWREADEIEVGEEELSLSAASDQARYLSLPSAMGRAESYAAWRKDLIETLYRSNQIELLRSRQLKLLSRPGEPESAFRIRLQHAARELRDELKEKLRKKYEPKFKALQVRRQRAELAVEREAQQASAAKLQTGISVGATLLGALFGRRSSSIGRATTAARSAGRTVQQWKDIERAKEGVAIIDQQLLALNDELQREVEQSWLQIDPASEPLETVSIKPKKTDISIDRLALAWVPR